MTFKTCLTKLTEEGVIDRDRARRFGELFDEIEAGYVDRYGATPATVLAGEETLKALEWDAQLRRRQSALQIEAQKRGLGEMNAYAKGDIKKFGEAVRGMMARFLEVPLTSVESRAQMIEFEMHGQLAGFIEHHRRDWRGRPRDKVGLEDMVRARHGEAVASPSAKAFSDAIGAVFEDLRQRFNALGGDIGYDAKYGLPRKWDAVRVRAATFEQFRADMLPELDRARMVDPKTGLAFSDAGLNDALKAVYETIRTDGMAGNGTARVSGAGKLADRRSDARFLQFRDADAWLRVNDKYGSADPFTAIMDHVAGMASDIAMMERFGPDPNATVKWMSDQAQRAIRQSPDRSAHPINIANAEAKSIEKLWAEVSGQAGIPVLGGPLRSVTVKSLHGLRDITTSAKLGKAAISAFFGDMGNIKTIRAFNGIAGTSDLMGYLREFKPQSAADRQLAADLELGLQDAVHSMVGLNRYFGKSQSPALTKIIADNALRMTGLNKVTEAGQRHFSKTFLWSLARERGKTFDQLDASLAASMRRYGIDAADWDAMRRADTVTSDGWDSREFMAAQNVRKINPVAAEKMMDMVLSERSAAVIETNARARALLNLGPAGSFAGEASRSLFQFKTFTASMIMAQGERILARPDLATGAAVWRGGIYAARMFITLTLFGSAIVQMRQISAGKDARPMENWEFWVDAMVAGGGMAILGDVIGTFKNEDMAGIGGIASGPLMGMATDAGKLLGNNTVRAIKGEDTHYGRDLVNFLRKNTPGSSTWYYQIALQRLIFDELRTLADPDYRDAWRAMERKAHDQGTDFYWAPGETAPARAPDLSNAFAQPEEAPQP